MLPNDTQFASEATTPVLTGTFFLLTFTPACVRGSDDFYPLSTDVKLQFCRSMAVVVPKMCLY
jgi:hypothetical protein